MSLEVVTFGKTGSSETFRSASPAIWGDCPWTRILKGSVDGKVFFDDFDIQPVTVPTSEAAYGPYYRGFTSTGGTINAATQTAEGKITLGSDGDDEGASIQTLGSPFKIATDQGKFWFECRVKVTSITVTIMDCFIGLVEKSTLTATVPITATAGTLADKNYLGFLRPGTSATGDGSLLKAVYRADGQTAVTLQSTASTFVADTYIKLGITFDPRDNKVRTYVNNAEQSSTYTVTTTAGNPFPNDVLLCPTAAVLNTAGTITDVFSVDWWRFAQVAA